MQRNAIRLPVRILSQRPPALQRSRPSWLSPIASPAPTQSRNFAISPALYKKKDKTKKAEPAESSSNSSSGASSSATADPFDLSKLETGLATAAARLKDDLSKLRAGGRFNTASLEALKVQLGKESSSTFKLGDLAQVVPKGGRMVTLLASEEDVSFCMGLRSGSPRSTMREIWTLFLFTDSAFFAEFSTSNHSRRLSFPPICL